VLNVIPNPVKALLEMKRVVKKDGKVILIEAVQSKDSWNRFMQFIMNPFTQAIFGYSTNADTVSAIIESGLKIEKDEKLALKDVFRRFTCVKI